MQKRFLGKTNLEVSRIGLGTVKFGRNQGVKYPKEFQLPSDYEIENLLNCASNLGINLLDTAPAYGSSEERLGKILQGKRNQWIITTKVGEEFCDGISHFDFSEKGVSQSITRSLQRLKTDYLDIVLVHSNGDDKKIIESGIFSQLEIYKKEGKIRAFGMSTKTMEGGLLTIDHADVAMVTYHPAYTDERSIIQYAHQKQKSIFIKKALASGHLQTFSSANPIAESLQFIFAEAGVTSVIIGTINPKHLRENVEVCC